MRILLALTILALVSCNDNNRIAGSTEYPAKALDAPIEVFTGDNKPTGAYEQIGIVRIRTTNKTQDITEYAQRKARKIGGDAVIMNFNASLQDGHSMTEALVIRYK